MNISPNIHIKLWTRVLGESSACHGWNENCRQSVYVHVLLPLLDFSFESSLISLGEKVLYVGIKLVICVYVNVLKESKSHVTSHDFYKLYLCSISWTIIGEQMKTVSCVTSCTFCRSATMFVRSFCSFSSASLSLTSLLLLLSSTALALASARLWYELHNDCRPDSYCWKYSF